jgi:cytochrome c553
MPGLQDTRRGILQTQINRCTSNVTPSLTKALHDYKSNVRVGGGVAAMADVAYSLSDEEIEALAHYLAYL